MKNFIGNDIVDLTTSDAINFSASLRFVKRVLTEEEYNYYILNGSSPTLFWIHWAAKESVFKIVKKISSDVNFSHQAFQLNLEYLSDESGHGVVTYKSNKYQVAFSISEKLVHCIACPEVVTGHIVSEVKALDKISRVESSFSNRELHSVHSGESFLVRCLLKNMLKDITGKDYEILRQPLPKNYGPPEVWLEGKRCESIDISMSHDGDYCAGLVLFNSLESCQ